VYLGLPNLRGQHNTTPAGADLRARGATNTKIADPKGLREPRDFEWWIIYNSVYPITQGLKNNLTDSHIFLDRLCGRR